MNMKTVGVRDLKEHLSRYLKMVKSGERIIVTDRQKEVALLIPYGMETDEEKLLRSVQRGVAYWTGGKPKGMVHLVVSRGKKVSDAVLEDRGE
jgi:prevent-host-death family protein